MKKLLGLGLALALVLLAANCSELDSPRPMAPVDGADGELEALAAALAAEAGWPIEIETSVEPALVDRACFQFTRTQVAGDIYHYSWRIPVGSGEHDVIGLHRVVRERRPWRPIRSRDAIMLQHGDIKDFTGMFLPGTTSETMPDDFGLAVTLAAADIDVWGIDQGWTLVSAEVSDFTFMADWGMDRQIEDLGTAIDLARILRLFSGNGWRKVALLGYSSGASTGFAFVNGESQLPMSHRRVSGFIPADFGSRSDHADFIATFEAECAGYIELWEAGVYQSDSPFQLFGPPAAQDPDGPSALIPGFTNLQAALGLGTWDFYPDFTYHFLAGEFDADGVPSGLQYTDIDMWIDFMVSGPPYEPYRFMIDYELCVIAPESVPWDDYLSAVTLPVLYLTAEGGAGTYAEYTLSLLGSSDIEVLRFGFHPPEEDWLEFGHVDMFIANDAPTLIFEPIRDWVLAH